MDDENTRTRIRERAYYLWESEGRPHGRALDHWLEAERHDCAVGSAEPHTSEAIGTAPPEVDRAEQTFARSIPVEQKASDDTVGKTRKKVGRGRSRGEALTVAH